MSELVQCRVRDSDGGAVWWRVEIGQRTVVEKLGMRRGHSQRCPRRWQWKSRGASHCRQFFGQHILLKYKFGDPVIHAQLMGQVWLAEFVHCDNSVGNKGPAEKRSRGDRESGPPPAAQPQGEPPPAGLRPALLAPGNAPVYAITAAFVRGDTSMATR